jgi:hypothetical protein
LTADHHAQGEHGDRRAADQLTLIAELAIPVIGDTVVGARLSPIRQ